MPDQYRQCSLACWLLNSCGLLSTSTQNFQHKIFNTNFLKAVDSQPSPDSEPANASAGVCRCKDVNELQYLIQRCGGSLGGRCLSSLHPPLYQPPSVLGQGSGAGGGARWEGCGREVGGRGGAPPRGPPVIQVLRRSRIPVLRSRLAGLSVWRFWLRFTPAHP